MIQVSGGSQSFNAVDTLRLLGRWMRMVTIPNRSSIAMTYQDFDEAAGRMTPSSYYDRIVDVMEELVRFTILLHPHARQFVDRIPSARPRDRTWIDRRSTPMQLWQTETSADGAILQSARCQIPWSTPR